MKFAELSESAKDTVREQQVTDEWWQFAVEQHKVDLAEKGFADADISFSGFSSQGDGASFTANATVDFPEELRQAIDDHNRCAAAVARLNGQRRPEDYTYEIVARIKRDHSRYCHSNTMYAEIEVHSYPYASDIPLGLSDRIDAWQTQAEKALCSTARGLADDIYRALEKEYDYLRSDDAIIERAEDYDEEGNYLPTSCLTA